MAYSWRISGAFYTVPYTTTYGTHRKGTAKVIEDYPWAVVIVSDVVGEEEIIYQGSRVWSAWDMEDGDREADLGSAKIFCSG